jgi:hypothetical protein
MRAVVQRVTQAKVEVEGAIVGEIAAGLLVLLGVGKADTPADAAFLAVKIAGLRIFADQAGKMISKWAARCWWCRNLRCMAIAAKAGGRASTPPRLANRLALCMSISWPSLAGLACVSKPAFFRPIWPCRSPTMGPLP